MATALLFAAEDPRVKVSINTDPVKNKPRQLNTALQTSIALLRMDAGGLTRFLEDQAIDLGFDEIFLRVDPQNEAAIPMYISLDYTPTGDHKLTTYNYVDGLGNTHAREEMDAIYRKSLRLLRL